MKRLILLFFAILMVPGCGAPEARFRLNMVYHTKQGEEASEEGFTPEQVQDVTDILTAMFGTPDEPFLPTTGDSRIGEIVDIDKIQMAAGRVRRTEYSEAGEDEGDFEVAGLFRKHCAHCHGVSGDGLGPTAPFLNPYPRDYRKGVFKFKSTPKGGRPTDSDIKRILINGIPGTSMPSFQLLPDTQIDALVDYVKYLSIRGEVERRLVDDLALELEEGERLEIDAEFLVDDVLTEVTARWLNAEALVPSIPPRPDWNEEETLASIRRGRELFFGAISQCVKCHGESQLGDGQTDDYDDWVKDFEDLTAATSADDREEKIARFVSLGGLPPRNIRPRNLREGIYRGGRRPIDLYLRILNGIDGTPMPAAAMKPPGAPANAQGLTSDDIWHLVDYVRSLPYESLGTPGHDPAYMRQRF